MTTSELKAVSKKKIRIWTVESDNDKFAVDAIAKKLCSILNRDDIAISSAGKRTWNTVLQKDKNGGLNKAVLDFLDEDDAVIFLLDQDNPAAQAERREQRNSFISKISGVTNQQQFHGKVFMLFMVMELEAWLLVDCLGIAAFFWHSRRRRNQKINEQHIKEARVSVEQSPNLLKIVEKSQKGNTETIVEAESGGKGVKEYLAKYSQKILLGDNSKLKPKDIDKLEYKESMSSSIVPFIDLTKATIKRNPSLNNFFDRIAKVVAN
jgi:hypothetical protein